MAFGSSRRDVEFRLTGDSRDLRRATDDASEGFDDATESADRMGEGWSIAKGIAADLASEALQAAIEWGVAGIDMAETAEKVAKAFDETFGDAAADMNEDLEEVRRNAGLSSAEFQELAVGIGQTATALGANREEAALWVEQILTMSADIATFRGDAELTDDVMKAFEEALKGNVDALSDFGVVTSKAEIEQRALRHTGKKTTEELTEQDKTAALLAIAQEQLADETGSLSEAMAEGSTTAAQLDADMEDAQITMGSALKPVKDLGLEILLGLTPAIEALTPVVRFAGWAIMFVVDAEERMAKSTELVKTAIEKLTTPISNLVRWLRTLSSNVSTARSRLAGLFRIRAPSSWLSGITSNLPWRHSGGTVPGPTGSNQLIMAQGGERIYPAGARTGTGGDSFVTVNIEAGIVLNDPMEVGRQIRTILEEYDKQNGVVG